MNWGSRASQVIDLIHLQQYRFDHIMPNKLEPRIPKMVHYILLPPSKEIINDNHIIPSSNEFVDQMTSHESGSTSHHNSQPPSPNSNRNSPNLARSITLGIWDRNLISTGYTNGNRSGYSWTGLGGAEARQTGLNNEERGANEDTH